MRPWETLLKGFRERWELLGKLRDAGWALSLALCGVQCAWALIPAASAVTMGLLVGDLERSLTFGRALVPLAAFAVVLLAGHVLDAAASPLQFAVQSRIDGRHRAAVARLAASTPTLAELERQHVQNLIRVADADPDNWTERTLGNGTVSLVGIVISYAGVASSCSVLAFFSPWLVPAIIIPAWVGGALGLRRLRGDLRRWTAGIMDGRRSDYWKEVATSPATGKELRIFGFGGWAIDRSQRHLHAMFDPVWRGRLAQCAQNPLIMLALGGVPIAVSFALVAAGTAGGHHSVAAETAVLAAGMSVATAVTGVISRIDVEGALPCLRALNELRSVLEEADASPAGVMQRAGVPELPRAPQPVLLKGICFSYPGSGGMILQDLSLEIRPGELLAIVGLNGSGKSTLVKLLAGLHRPSHGSITAGGTDIFADLAAWRRRISVVFQDFAKYELSARDNVALAGAQLAELEAAARESGLQEVLANLPGGWDTPLARSRTGGVDLSGGQWQQVALARALYAVATGAWLLVLDEPAAHLDVRTEFELFERLAGRAGDTSVVLISHRLSTVRQADRIVLLERLDGEVGGRISESGSHQELMALGGRYAAMFELQAERFRQGYRDRTDP